MSAITASTPYERVVDGGQSLQANRLNQPRSEDSSERYPEDDLSGSGHDSEDVNMIDVMRNRLYDSSTRIPSATDMNKWFITKERLKAIMRVEEVSSALKSLNLNSQTDRTEMARKICAAAASHGTEERKSYRAIFALLIMIGQHADIEGFVDRTLDDSRLPFERHGWAGCGGVTQDCDKVADTHPLTVFAWPNNKKEDFLRTQWELIPAFFGKQGKKVPHYPLRPEQVLPYSHSEAADTAAEEDQGHMEGAFGFVTVYDLHEDQQDLDRHTVSYN